MLDRNDDLRDALKRAAAAFKAHGPQFALGGSYALWVYGAPEPVHDVDFVVAETDAEALALARRAYPRWHDSFTYLHRRHNYAAMHPRPPDFDGIAAVGQGVAGSASTVAAFLREQLHATGSNYCVGQFAFGDLSLADTQRSIALFAREVMPALQFAAAVPAV